MRLLIVSDSHGRTDNLFKILRREKDFQYFIHLGDAEGCEDEIRREIDTISPLCAVNFVRGNMDDDIRLPVCKTLEVSFVKLFLTHGHRYQVGNGLDILASNAYQNGCAYALFGHTHKPCHENVMGVECFNPGSISYPRTADRKASYGVMTVDRDGYARLELKYV